MKTTEMKCMDCGALVLIPEEPGLPASHAICAKCAKAAWERALKSVKVPPTVENGFTYAATKEKP